MVLVLLLTYKFVFLHKGMNENIYLRKGGGGINFSIIHPPSLFSVEIEDKSFWHQQGIHKVNTLYA